MSFDMGLLWHELADRTFGTIHPHIEDVVFIKDLQLAARWEHVVAGCSKRPVQPLEPVLVVGGFSPVEVDDVEVELGEDLRQVLCCQLRELLALENEQVVVGCFRLFKLLLRKDGASAAEVHQHVQQGFDIVFWTAF